ncbi:MAG TPA: hypothetical protein QGF58_22985 [Myxococcota bacterium]|nr:hypothetical protein [Myxococcota bacterium]
MNKTQAPKSVLSKDEDKANKPGFRDPANKRSKASKKKKNKRKKK